MNRRPLGKSGLLVSEVGLGCEHLQGMEYGQIKAVVDAALDAGINIFDIFMALAMKQYEVQEIEASAKVTVENGSTIIHSDDVVQQLLDESLVNAINALSEVG